ncbi:hypothetical protein [Hymenobacter arcticus]
MTQKKKALYRDLLRWAMVDMRMHSASATTGLLRLFTNRRPGRLKVIQFIHAMNNWLHNTALYSAVDFEGFKEELFWEDYRRFRHDFPADRWAGLTETVIKELLASVD